MKLSLNTDFTSLPRVDAIRPAAESADLSPAGTVPLRHDERHLKRRVLTTNAGERILVDLPDAASLADGDCLLLDDGRVLAVEAAREAIYEIVPRDAVHLAELAWQLGSRHCPVAVAEGRIVVLRDPAVKAMLEGLGAQVHEAEAPFGPLPAALAEAGHDGHRHAHHDHGHHHHGELDRFGRKPGDPHYGHNHP